MTSAPHQPFTLVRGIAAACCLLPLADAAPVEAATASWEAPRRIEDFSLLLKKSPFSLPTAESSSPLAERYAITGIVSIGGEEQVFVFDRTDQSRELLTRKPNAKNMALLSILREGGATPTKATIRVGEESGTIGYLEAAPQQATPNAPAQAATATAAQGAQGARTATQLPPPPRMPQGTGAPSATTPQAPGTVPGNTPPNRRLIRRPVVLPQQAKPATP